MTEFTVDTAELRKALGVLTSNKISKAYLPILGGVRCAVQGGTVRLSRTDLDVWAHCTMVATDASDGVVIVDAKQLKAAIPTGKGSTTVVKLDGAGTVQASFGEGAPSVTLPCLDVEKWPKGWDLPSELAHVLATPMLDVVQVASTDYARPILTGVYLDGHRAVATDSYRLYVHDRPADEPALTALTARKAWDLVAKVIGKGTHVGVGFDEKENLTVTVDSWMFQTANQYGEYVSYDRLTPSASLPYVIDMSNAAGVLDACKKSSRELPARFTMRELPARFTMRELPARFTMQADGLRVEGGKDRSVSCTLTAGRSTIPEGFSIGFNPAHLSELLKGTDGQLTVTDALKPALWVGDADGRKRTRLLMPVRVS